VGARLGAGLAAAGLVLMIVRWLEPGRAFDGVISPLIVAGIAGTLVLLLPRLGWLATAATAVLWLALVEGLPGSALVVAVMALVPPLLLPRAGLLWSLPALAPLLGVVAIAPLFVAVAGLASTAWRRAALGAAGFAWLAGAELLSGRTLLFGAPRDAATPRFFDESPSDAVAEALLPLVSTPALAPALVWAAFAAVLPLLVRREGTTGMIGALVWAVGLVAAHVALGQALAESVTQNGPRGAVAGALLGLLVAAGIGTLTPRRGAVGTEALS